VSSSDLQHEHVVASNQTLLAVLPGYLDDQTITAWRLTDLNHKTSAG
jgi:hypothetical protein